MARSNETARAISIAASQTTHPWHPHEVRCQTRGMGIRSPFRIVRTAQRWISQSPDPSDSAMLERIHRRDLFISELGSGLPPRALSGVPTSRASCHPRLAR